MSNRCMSNRCLLAWYAAMYSLYAVWRWAGIVCNSLRKLVSAVIRMRSVRRAEYSIPNRNLHSAEDPSTFLVVLSYRWSSYRWSTRRCRGLRPAGIVESAPGVPAHPEGPLSRLLRSSRRPEEKSSDGERRARPLRSRRSTKSAK